MLIFVHRRKSTLIGYYNDLKHLKKYMTNKGHHKCVIVGSGPSGYTAGIYASRAGLEPVLFTGLQQGGQLMDTNDVDNFPGYPDGVNGAQLMEDLKNQALRFGTDLRQEIVTHVDFSGDIKVLTIDNSYKITAQSVIISTGATAKWLGLDSETEFRQKGGVSACATCDGFFFQGEDVIVVGGGDTALEEATFLANICKKVTILVRGDKMRGSKIMQDKAISRDNIEILYNTSIEEIKGDDSGVTNVDLNTKGDIINIETKAVFIAIGHKPNTEIFKDYIDLDENGYVVKVDSSTKTNVEGVFVAGDVADTVYRQAITASGTGCMSALDAERYLSELD
jgi:thioredoxin reductase (NADPH)